MKINLARNISFCDGVDRAYQLVNDLSKKKAGQRMLILGSLVHNQGVIRAVKKWGIGKIKTLRSLRPGDTVIITAHGAGKNIFDSIERKDAVVFNATCPKVIKVQRLAKFYHAKGAQVLIFGDKYHNEVQGINGWCDNSAIIFKDLSEARQAAGKLKRAGKKNIVLVCQTTQNIELFKKIASFLRKELRGIKILDTICRATHNRQKEIRQLARKNDAVIIIGDKGSGNTKRLWQVAKSINKNSLWISELDKARQKILSDGAKSWRRVGVISGASTPQWEIEAVVQALKN